MSNAGHALRHTYCFWSSCGLNQATKAFDSPNRSRHVPFILILINVPTTDVHIILNTVQSPSIFNSPAPASWIPICLPKYNPQSFVHAYISFLRRREVHGMPDRPPTPVPESDVPEETVGPNSNVNNYAVTCNEDLQSPSILLVCISTGADMDVVRGWCNSATEVGNYLFNVIFDLDVLNTCRNSRVMAYLQKSPMLAVHVIPSIPCPTFAYLACAISSTNHERMCR